MLSEEVSITWSARRAISTSSRRSIAIPSSTGPGRRVRVHPPRLAVAADERVVRAIQEEHGDLGAPRAELLDHRRARRQEAGLTRVDGERDLPDRRRPTWRRARGTGRSAGPADCRRSRSPGPRARPSRCSCRCPRARATKTMRGGAPVTSPASRGAASRQSARRRSRPAARWRWSRAATSITRGHAAARPRRKRDDRDLHAADRLASRAPGRPARSPRPRSSVSSWHSRSIGISSRTPSGPKRSGMKTIPRPRISM